MRFLPRFIVFFGLTYLALILFQEGQKIQSHEPVDHTKVFLIFGSTIIIALIAGGIVAFTFLPFLGDKIGSLIYGASESDTSDPLVQAHVQIEEHNYAGAIESYRKALARDPDDTAAMGEIADLQCKHLGEYEAAAGLLEQALERHWPIDEKSFLRCKLAEVYGKYLGDMNKARALLLETLEEAPGTAYARNAEHLMLELESA